MPKPKPLSERELNLITMYTNWNFSMTPIEFYNKWQVSYDQIALICHRSDSTVHRWLRQRENQRQPHQNDLLCLALMDFMLEHFEEIPEDLRRLLCIHNL